MIDRVDTRDIGASIVSLAVDFGVFIAALTVDMFQLPIAKVYVSRRKRVFA